MHRILEICWHDRAQRSLLWRLDVRVKLLSAFAALVAILLSQQPALPMLIFAACLASWLVLRMPKRLLLVRLAAPTLIAAAVFTLQATLGPSPRMSLAGLSVSQPGVAVGTLTASRVLASVSVLILLATVTPSHSLFAALRWMRVPRTFVEIAVLMYRHIWELLRQASEVSAAQRVRLGHVGFGRAMASTGRLMGTVLLRSIDQADRTHEAMLVRGYGQAIPLPQLSPMRTAQWLHLGAFVAAMAAAYLLVGRAAI